MKTEDYLGIAILGAAAYVIWKLNKGVDAVGDAIKNVGGTPTSVSYGPSGLPSVNPIGDTLVGKPVFDAIAVGGHNAANYADSLRRDILDYANQNDITWLNARYGGALFNLVPNLLPHPQPAPNTQLPSATLPLSGIYSPQGNVATTPQEVSRNFYQNNFSSPAPAPTTSPKAPIPPTPTAPSPAPSAPNYRYADGTPAPKGSTPATDPRIYYI